MPVLLKIDRERKLVYSSFFGRVTDQELIEHRQTISSDPDFDRDFSEIVDFTAVTDVAVSEATLSGMASSHSVFSDSVQHVVIAPEQMVYKLASQFQNLARDKRPNLAIVRSRAEAYQLVGLRPD